MELCSQIKKYRMERKMSQEDLAEKVYVTRQTISNWENGKSYPDIHSLLLLSSVFELSLDQLVKGDIKRMEEKINEAEVKKFNHYGTVYAVLLVIFCITVVPLAVLLKVYGMIISALLYIIALYYALKLEKIKKEQDIQSYKEIVEFSKGKRLDEITKGQEYVKRPYQNIFKVFFSALIMFVIAVLCVSIFKALNML